jgi:hypothetical protein
MFVKIQKPSPYHFVMSSIHIKGCIYSLVDPPDINKNFLRFALHTCETGFVFIPISPQINLQNFNWELNIPSQIFNDFSKTIRIYHVIALVCNKTGLKELEKYEEKKHKDKNVKTISITKNCYIADTVPIYVSKLAQIQINKPDAKSSQTRRYSHGSYNHSTLSI